MCTELRRGAVLVALLISGCFNPDDLIPIRGSVDAPGQRVELLRAVRCDDAWQALKDTNADESGAFSFEVFRAQIQNLGSRTPHCLRAQSTFPSGTRAESTIRQLQLVTTI
ncbi:MAG: hypothetical protein ACO1OB_21130, partial [Archangium sp.]